jgi:hypothetical protein
MAAHIFELSRVLAEPVQEFVTKVQKLLHLPFDIYESPFRFGALH